MYLFIYIYIIYTIMISIVYSGVYFNIWATQTVICSILPVFMYLNFEWQFLYSYNIPVPLFWTFQYVLQPTIFHRPRNTVFRQKLFNGVSDHHEIFT